jgi:hypothetical protein
MLAAGTETRAKTKLTKTHRRQNLPRLCAQAIRQSNPVLKNAYNSFNMQLKPNI